MVNSAYIVSVFVAAILGWSSWIVVINKLSPFMSGYLALALFYASLFVAAAATGALLIFYLRLSIAKKKEDAVPIIHTALRQGSLLAAMVCAGLVFQRLRVLTWWDALLLMLIVVLIEYYFSARD
jgi:hypothetical protein